VLEFKCVSAIRSAGAIAAQKVGVLADGWKQRLRMEQIDKCGDRMGFARARVTVVLVVCRGFLGKYENWKNRISRLETQQSSKSIHIFHAEGTSAGNGKIETAAAMSSQSRAGSQRSTRPVRRDTTRVVGAFISRMSNRTRNCRGLGLRLTSGNYRDLRFFAATCYRLRGANLAAQSRTRSLRRVHRAHHQSRGELPVEFRGLPSLHPGYTH